MYISPESHLDHGLELHHIRFILDRFAHHVGNFAETVELDQWMNPLPCSLYGPIMGDEPVDPLDVDYRRRGNRAWSSPILVSKPNRWSTQLTVIGGPDQFGQTILYTAFGGPLAPQEPGDPNCVDVAASEEFWSHHALSYQAKD